MAKEFQLKAIISAKDKLSPALKKVQDNAKGFRKKLLQSGLGKPINLSGILSGGALAAPFVAGAKAAIDFESAMADVRKVVSFETPEQFKEMSDDILDMSKRMPMAATEISAIFAAGGQASIAREDLKGFAEDAVKMGVAFNTTADDAGQTMAQWRAAFKFNQEEVAQLADQVNELGNKGAASAGQIAKVVTAIGPLASVAGVSSSELAALGATLVGVGVDESVAGTGLKKFFETLGSGDSATTAQKNVLKALRLDPKELAEGMTTDAKGTMLHVLKAISKVDKSKQVAVMKQLFGASGMNAVAPLLESLETLEHNFDVVADKTQYAGSMQREYAARSATTANAMQLFRNRIAATGVALGSALLPAINDFLAMAGPIIDMVTSLVAENPWLIKGLIGAAGAFLAMRLAVSGTAKAMQIFNNVTNLSPIGIAVRLLAFAAGMLIANWDKVAPFFKNMWEGIKNYAQDSWTFLKDLFFNWHPLGIIIKNWEPIVDWFKDLWDRVMVFIEPILNGMEKVKAVTSGIADTVSDTASNAWKSAKEGAAGLTESMSSKASSAWGGFKSFMGFGDGPAKAAPTGPAPVVKAETKVDGEFVVNFRNAPPGMTVVDQSSNQSGIKTRANVGMSSLAGAYP